MELKPRQQEAYAAVFAALDRGIDRQLVSLPTGWRLCGLDIEGGGGFGRAVRRCERFLSG